MKILSEENISNFILSSGLLPPLKSRTVIFTSFWTGVIRFNMTHFMSRMQNGEKIYFIPSEYFQSSELQFMPIVLHHVPRYNIEACSNIKEIYSQGTGYFWTKSILLILCRWIMVRTPFSDQGLHNKGAKTRAFCICWRNRPYLDDIMSVCKDLLPIFVLFFILVTLIFILIFTYYFTKLNIRNDEE